MRLYIDHFHVDKHVSLNSEVIQIEKVDGLWNVSYKNKWGTTTLQSHNIALCTGQNSICLNYPDIDTSAFRGKILHASTFDETVMTECLNKRILIYGGSDTAADIAVELTNNMYTATKYNGKKKFGFTGPNGSIDENAKTIVYMSMRKGRWIQRRTTGTYEPADMFYNRIVNAVFKTLSKSLVESTFVPQLEGWWGKSGHGVPEWETDAGYLNSYYVKSADILPKITFGEVIPLRDITTINSTSVITVDEEEIDIDVIIFATGYKGMSCYTFIPEEIKKGHYYDHIFMVEDPTVVKVGFIRPYLTSIPMIIEMQSRYVAAVFAKKCKLPDAPAMMKAYTLMKEAQAKEFEYDSERVEGIIDPYDYMDMVAVKIGAKPSFAAIAFSDPKLFYYIIFHTWSHFVYRLNDADPTKKAIARQEILELEYNNSSKKAEKITILLILALLFVVFIVFTIIIMYFPSIYKFILSAYRTSVKKYIKT